MRDLLLTLSIVTLASMSTITQAQQVLATCGASEGMFYTPEDGWAKDQISSGTITAMQMADDSYDLIIKSVGGAFSTKGDGGGVFLAWGEPEGGAFGLIAVYPLRSAEIYGFKVDSLGVGEVIWSGVRDAPIIGFNGKLMQAPCG